MMNLKIIENELVPVYETNKGEKVVYGTELHAVLGVKSKFADWAKNRLKDCDAVENEDFEAFSKNLENGGRMKEYIIKLDTAKEMAMLERNNKGKQVRRYFIQVEKKYRSSHQNMSQGNSVFLETFQKFMEVQMEFMEKQAAFNSEIAAKMESINKDFPERSIIDFSRMEQELSVRERKQHLYELVQENAGLRGMSINSFLHVMYGVIERQFHVNLNSYRSVYCSDMGKPKAGIVEVIAANDRFYDLAVELNEFMIKDYEEQEALKERMKEFEG